MVQESTSIQMVCINTSIKTITKLTVNKSIPERHFSQERRDLECSQVIIDAFAAVFQTRSSRNSGNIQDDNIRDGS